MSFPFCHIGASNFTEAMKIGSEVYHHLKSVIKNKFGLDATAVGDEGGFAPNIQNNKEGLQLIKDAINQAGYTGKVEIGMDVAASEFFRWIAVKILQQQSGLTKYVQELHIVVLCMDNSTVFAWAWG